MQLPQDTFSVVVKTNQEMLFTGKIHALSSTNAKGDFDVLSAHTAFVSLVEKFVRVYTSSSGKHQEFSFQKGVLHVTPTGEVVVFVKS